ncbi:MAG TPA: hypothetical protein VES68_00520 [Candidatus Sulfotelmatobacter sp.]|nr:hypothetical protein [Candidatus Sulfotelmatobacter sp.]
MFTLSDASTDTKKIITGIGIFIGACLAIFLFIKIALFIKEVFYPTPPPKPLVAFDKLQPQVFPQNVTDKALTYSVNTVTGNLPQFPNQTKVYRMKPIRPDLLAVNKFQDKITQVGYLSGYTTVSDKVFEWKSSPRIGELDKRIRTNVVDGSFTITSLYSTDADVLAAKSLPNQDKAIKKAQEFLQNMQMIPDDIDLSKNKTILFFITDRGLSSATSLSNAQIIEVNFFQKDVNSLQIYYEKPFSSNISILMASGGINVQDGQIVGASYINQQVSDESSTYPIKTTNQAFEELKQGRAYIASYFGSSSSINITDISLGYYIGSQPQDFLMPIFVFKGDDGFTAYVPAVTDELINM